MKAERERRERARVKEKERERVRSTDMDTEVKVKVNAAKVTNIKKNDGVRADGDEGGEDSVQSCTERRWTSASLQHENNESVSVFN